MRRVCRGRAAAGQDEHGTGDGQEGVVRAYGAREIATGVAILASHDPTPWIWGRVVGGALDIATVAALPSNRRDGEDRRWWTVGALIAVAALDAFTANCLTAEKGGPRTARTDYRDRSGIPNGIEAARGAARGFAVDRRGPEALRQQISQHAS